MQVVNFTFRGLLVPVFTPFNNDTYVIFFEKHDNVTAINEKQSKHQSIFRDRSLNLSIIPEYAKYLALKNIKGVLGTFYHFLKINNYLMIFIKLRNTYYNNF